MSDRQIDGVLDAVGKACAESECPFMLVAGRPERLCFRSLRPLADVIAATVTWGEGAVLRREIARKYDAAPDSECGDYDDSVLFEELPRGTAVGGVCYPARLLVTKAFSSREYKAALADLPNVLAESLSSIAARGLAGVGIEAARRFVAEADDVLVPEYETKSREGAVYTIGLAMSRRRNADDKNEV
jgi:hypothetical protein